MGRYGGHRPGMNREHEGMMQDARDTVEETAPAPHGVVVEDAAARRFAGPGEMRGRFRDADWAATPLGPVEAWPASLRCAAGLMLAAPTPMTVLWGPELVQFYNDAHARLMGDKHPGGLGQPTRECWPE